ncbi:MAG: 4-hydroxybenzoate polyprenyltransferase [Polynucleobacter sp. 24-46-87]|jgi:4-hydroxybenzoate polyprenyltransferase|uniref:4-hydroxybenzoate octaprenyltransferase n=1 Tax=unclassified Polynucleobacter TaxID=2640945 RepID=UPI000BD13F2E|nr:MULTISPECIES: 4-hydroxybenzoate octaprenyltransferase [unclassified Polynucleobacter]OYY18457.1 MAG: 4-hydroxybenzoate polyprenyltransferase [Polynucleobacter sp. 35-46-11]OZA15046.1 MAG: 4-hydroxybenzoate polyprenyltransferase [Polynucleobacter sp. 24-46-87]OZA76887.1 MAG: 4-hydroxybenzoate polyprenyltransferase [Polynucleobacter sp. 39-46-10]
MRDRIVAYAYLIRLDKPIGTLLLLWPTLWALWLASGGFPELHLLIIFTLGTFLMRSAGCAVNDYADQDFDRHVLRTQDRPITSGKISGKEALLIAAMLALIAFLLIQPLNALTKELSFFALAIAILYPFTKRFFAIPQAVLGIAFGFGIPMAYAAVLGFIPLEAWILFIGNIFWAIAYDTAYAMVDRDDDLRLGLSTSAITFGRFDVLAIALSYGVLFLSQIWVAQLANLSNYFWVGWFLALACAMYHLKLVSTRKREDCFKAFRHNNWLGGFLFLGILLGLARL